MNNSSDPDRCDRRSIVGIEKISSVAIARIVHASFHKIAGITGVVHNDPNDRNDYMETRLKYRVSQKHFDVLMNTEK